MSKSLKTQILCRTKNKILDIHAMKKSEKETFAVTRKLGGDATFPINNQYLEVKGRSGQGHCLLKGLDGFEGV